MEPRELMNLPGEWLVNVRVEQPPTYRRRLVIEAMPEDVIADAALTALSRHQEATEQNGDQP